VYGNWDRTPFDPEHSAEIIFIARVRP
jgi:hypothetical protein